MKPRPISLHICGPDGQNLMSLRRKGRQKRMLWLPLVKHCIWRLHSFCTTEFVHRRFAFDKRVQAVCYFLINLEGWGLEKKALCRMVTCSWLAHLLYFCLELCVLMTHLLILFMIPHGYPKDMHFPKTVNVLQWIISHCGKENCCLSKDLYSQYAHAEHLFNAQSTVWLYRIQL